MKHLAAIVLAASTSASLAQICDQTEPTELIASDAIGYARAGYAVAAAGEIVVVGAYGDETDVVGGGSVKVYRQIDGVWTEEADLRPPTPHVGDWFGYSVATDGQRIVVGVPYGTAQGVARAGHAIVFEDQPGTGWTFVAQLSATPVFEDRFGSSVAIDGDRILVGVPGRDIGGMTDAGQAAVFLLDDGVWLFEETLRPPVSISMGNAGHSVDLDLPFAVFGAPNNGGNGAERAYVAELRESGWSFPMTLDALSSLASGAYGWAVAIHDGIAAVGSPDAQVGGNPNAGSVSVFNYAGGIWTPAQTLTPPYGSSPDERFGESIDIHGDGMIIGSPGRKNKQGVIAGYANAGGSWQLETSYEFGPVLPARSFFGTAVAISESSVVVGADSTDIPETNTGSAYIYATTCPCPADLDANGVLNFFDISEFVGAFNAGNPIADLAEPFGVFNFFDIAAYIGLFNAGCP